ncbi:MAG: hypothetical protein JZU60_02705 [Ilumatobacteraceae bacterium]|nr:hypothetical protein [Ilumatobacteraceae bacterium]
MANANRPAGFIPVQYLNGSPWNGQARIYSIAAAYATALYIGDPVKSSGTANADGVPGVILGAATGALRGVIVGLGTQEGLLANPQNLDITYRPGAATAKDWFCMVVDDPQVLFEIQEKANTTQLAAAQIGLNTVPVLAAGNGFTSGWQLASMTDATADVTATLQLKLMGLVRRQQNAFGAYAKHLVQINVHELAHGTGSLGV